MKDWKKQKQDEVITKLQSAMCDLQDALETLGLNQNNISYANDLYGAIEVLYFKKSPDGSFEEELHEKLISGEEQPMDFEEAKNCLLVRIENMVSGFTPDGAWVMRY